MCHHEVDHLVSNMNVAWTTPCIAEFKDSSMYAIFALVLGKE